MVQVSVVHNFSSHVFGDLIASFDVFNRVLFARGFFPASFRQPVRAGSEKFIVHGFVRGVVEVFVYFVITIRVARG